ncbi:MAG: hypothetical protein D4S01_10450 [Dehalococcoidia bacterium]|nr:MAG: hypothetical protein D4S01_10450 [Dehalococcoidia bacterium]
MQDKDYMKAMKKIEEENYENALKIISIENDSFNKKIIQNNIMVRKLKLERMYILDRENAPQIITPDKEVVS